MANKTGDPRGPGMPGSGGWFPATNPGPEPVLLGASGEVDLSYGCYVPQRGVYVAADDMLQAQVYSNGATSAILMYRLLLPDGTVLVSQDSISLNGARTQQFFSRQLAQGVLLSVTLIPAFNLPAQGLIYASIGLRRLAQGATSLHEVLCAGQVTQLFPLTWPDTALRYPTDGAGSLRSITGSVPAAGADISETVPSNTRWQLLALNASLVTAVAVAIRQATLLIDDGANVLYEAPEGPGQAASLTWEYHFASQGFAPVNTLTDVSMHYDNSLVLGPGYRIKTDTAAIQAADQWSAPQYLVREWADGL
jgi:hypothetical protein